jgi:DNA-directed RNA polymerase specialized sigma24 family protein
LVLYALGDLRYAEVAWILDVPVGTVRSRIHRARAVLREPLGRLRTSDVEESDGGDHSEGGTDG